MGVFQKIDKPATARRVKSSYKIVLVGALLPEPTWFEFKPHREPASKKAPNSIPYSSGQADWKLRLKPRNCIVFTAKRVIDRDGGD